MNNKPILRFAGREVVKNQHQYLDKDKEFSRTPAFNHQRTKFTPSASFDPFFMRKDDSSRSKTSGSSCSSVMQDCLSSTSTPMKIKTVDPLITYSIFQQGIPGKYYDAEDQDNLPPNWLLHDKENELTNIRYVIVDEPGDILITPKRSRVSFLHRTTNLSNSSNNFNYPTKLNQRNEQGTQYLPKAHALAWRTQRASKAALRKALQLHKKHSPKAKAVALKSVEVFKEVSLRSVELARKHSPTMRRHAR